MTGAELQALYCEHLELLLDPKTGRREHANPKTTRWMLQYGRETEGMVYEPTGRTWLWSDLHPHQKKYHSILQAAVRERGDHERRTTRSVARNGQRHRHDHLRR